MRKWIIAVAVLLTVPMVGAAAVIVTGPVQEQLVEGHTVFSVIQVRNATEAAKDEFAAAVAVLVRENVREITYAERFPGVLWFNDQYLVNPSAGQVQERYDPRYPCGAVIAVNAGDPLPTVGGVPVVPATARYVESYRITDPNDAGWEVDKWRYDPDNDPLTANEFTIWSTAVATTTRGNVGATAAQYATADDGVTRCQVVNDTSVGCGVPLLPFTDETPQRPGGYSSTGTWPTRENDPYKDNTWNGTSTNLHEGRRQHPNSPTGLCATTNAADSGYRTVSYNAVLYFFLSDLTVFQGVKDHRTGVGADASDISSCQPDTYNNAWPCPAGNDDREGNSHPYNPEQNWPRQLSEGRNNHGGSSGCGTNTDGTMKSGGPQYQHAVCSVDIYFGYSAAGVPVRVFPRVFDVEGRTAPYHCHEHMTTCNEEDAAPGTL